MDNEKCFKEIDDNSREDNTPFNYHSKLFMHINYDIIELHLSNLYNFKRTLSILRKTLIVKSIEMELKRDLHNNNDIITIADLCDQIIKLVTSNEHMTASTIWIYHIKKIIDEIVNRKEKHENNNYFEYSLDFGKIKSYLVIYHENYISQLKTARSDLNIGKDKIKNKNNILAEGLYDLIFKTQNVLSTINNSTKLEELLELKVNN